MFDDLINNVNKVSDNIQKLNGEIEIPTLSTNEIIYNIFVSEGMDKKVAYKIIYGELQYDSNGKLDHINGVVNEQKSKLKDTTKKHIDKKVKELKTSLNVIKQKSIEISKSATQLGVEIGAATVTVAASAVIMPIGSGLPVAFSAVQSVFSSLQSFKTLLTQLLPFFSSLTILEFAVPKDKLNSVVTPINTGLITINTVLATITSIITIITSFQKKLQTPPGVNGEPPEPIKLEINSNKNEIHQNEEVTLSVKATKGNWQDYKYKWSSNIDSSFNSTKSTIIDKPLTTTIYTIKVTDSDGNSTSDKIKIDVI